MYVAKLLSEFDLNTVAGECAVNGVKMESHLSWLAPGYTAPLEPRLLDMDTRLPALITDERKRKTLSVGALLSYLGPEDLKAIAAGNEVGQFEFL